MQKSLRRIMGIALIILLTVGCSTPATTPAIDGTDAGAMPTALPLTATLTSPSTSTPTTAPAVEDREDGLSSEEVATLSSLEKVDDHPLYIMHYHGAYETAMSPAEVTEVVTSVSPSSDLTTSPSTWACSLFAALADADNMLYGRNFDWKFSPAVLLFTDPPDGYASVSMVDIAYLVGEDKVRRLTDLPLAERRPLLRAPLWPFDGLNEHGLAVGMAAVPKSEMPYDPDRETIYSLRAIREMLDHARDVDEAVSILQSYNIKFGEVPLHYLIADSSGHAVLAEFYQGELVVMPNETPWHLATNFLRSEANETGHYQCRRYDRIQERLAGAKGRITAQNAMDLLSQVSQSNTQWSVVYEMSTGDVNVAMERRYEFEQITGDGFPPNCTRAAERRWRGARSAAVGSCLRQ